MKMAHGANARTSTQPHHDHPEPLRPRPNPLHHQSLRPQPQAQPRAGRTDPRGPAALQPLFNECATLAFRDRQQRSRARPHRRHARGRARAYNEGKVRKASHVVVLCTRQASPKSTWNVLAREQADGPLRHTRGSGGPHGPIRFREPALRATRRAALGRQETDLASRLLAGGGRGAGVDACPIEGFDRGAVDRPWACGRKAVSAVIVALPGPG